MQQTICLCMIVKNESAVIKETLENLVNHIKFSYWVIVDTGSTDNTKQIIKTFFKKMRIQGQLFDEEWRGFDYNRSHALSLAYNKTDYVFVFDADDRIEGDLTLPPKWKMIHDTYYMYVGRDLQDRNIRFQIFNNRRHWCYLAAIHEFPIPMKREFTNELIGGKYILKSNRTGARNLDPLKYLNDAKRAEKAYLDPWIPEGLELEYPNIKNDLRGRLAYYAAQSYKDHHENTKDPKYKDMELKWLMLRIDLGIAGSYIFQSHACQRAAIIMMNRGLCSEAIRLYELALKIDHRRMEPAYAMLLYYRQNDNMPAALDLYERIKKIYDKYDHTSYQFAKDVHEYKLDIEIFLLCMKLDNKCSAAMKWQAIKSMRNILRSADNYNYVVNLFGNLIPIIKELHMEDEMISLFHAFAKRICSAKLINAGNRNKLIRDMFGELVESYPVLSCPELCAKLTGKPKIILTMTTCKRFDLFSKTVSSMLRFWTDLHLIDAFYVIDDGSSEDERQMMKTMFPFFNYVYKSQEKKGHIESMIMIWDLLNELRPTYWIHLEDDFLFFKKENYVTRSMNYLQKHNISFAHSEANNIVKENVGQILANPKYKSTEGNDVSVGSTISQILFNPTSNEVFEDYIQHTGKKIDEGLLLHTYSNEKREYINCDYWPNYSFRPSMTLVDTILKIGSFEQVKGKPHFEMRYAELYTKAGYKTAYFEEMTSLHIGKLTNEKGDNAYTMNKVDQFSTSDSNVAQDINLEGYKFLANKDSPGFDLYHISRTSLQELKEIADKDPLCVGFNSWGYFKYKIRDPDQFIELKTKLFSVDGFYIKENISEIIKEEIEVKETMPKNQAYIEKQLSLPSIKGANTFVVNLKRRPDRKSVMESLLKRQIEDYQFFEAIDGKSLEGTDDIKALVKGNDFRNKKGVIGCALSHINLWCSLVNDSVNDYYVVLEDDINFCKNFKKNLSLCREFISKNLNTVDLLWLGYFMYDNHKEMHKNLYYNQNKSLSIHPSNRSIYIGGTIGYVVTKNGAQKMLDYINRHGVQHGIDFIMNKNVNLNIMECQPHIITSEWVQSSNSTVDSDIQNDKDCFEFVYKEETVSGYKFYRNMDSFGSDLYHKPGLSIEEMKAIADKDSRCVAFNTWGFFKFLVTPERDFVPLANRVMTVDGMYVKLNQSRENIASKTEGQKPALAKQEAAPEVKGDPMKLEGYTFYPNKDSFGFDIHYQSGKSLEEMKLICDANKHFKAFNTYGYIKYKVNAEKDLINLIHRSKHLVCDGMYVKNTFTNGNAHSEERDDVPDLKKQDPFTYGKPEVKFKCLSEILKSQIDESLLTESDNADYFLILNRPDMDQDIRTLIYNPEKTIIFQTQGFSVMNDPVWANPDPNKFMTILPLPAFNLVNSSLLNIVKVYEGEDMLDKFFDKIYSVGKSCYENSEVITDQKEAILLAKSKGYRRVLFLENCNIDMKKTNLALLELGDKEWNTLHFYGECYLLTTQKGLIRAIEYVNSTTAWAINESCYDEILADIEEADEDDMLGDVMIERFYSRNLGNHYMAYPFTMTPVTN